MMRSLSSIPGVVGWRDPTGECTARERVPIEARRHGFVAELWRGLHSRCGWSGTGRLVVGVSGGADSMSLLTGLVVLRDRSEGDEPWQRSAFEIAAVHVNHHLRAEADQDAKFVAGACEQLGVACRVMEVHPGEVDGNIAAAARAMRYGALALAARECGAGAVVTGHHAEDQLETMIISLCRGAGLEGLRGMPWRRELEDVQLMRPLLGVRKRECEAFCRVAGVAWVEDPSNLRKDRTRSRLRRDVMPVLEELWPGCAERTVGVGDALETAKLLFDERVEAVFGATESRVWERALLQAQPSSIVAAGLRRAAVRYRGEAADDLGQRQLLEAAEMICSKTTSPKEFTWPRGMRLRVNAREVTLEGCEA